MLNLNKIVESPKISKNNINPKASKTLILKHNVQYALYMSNCTLVFQVRCTYLSFKTTFVTPAEKKVDVRSDCGSARMSVA